MADNFLGDPYQGQIPSPTGGFGFSGLGSAISTQATPGGLAVSPTIGSNFGLNGGVGGSALGGASGGNWGSGGGATAGSSQPTVTPYSFTGSNTNGSVGNGSFGSFTNGGVVTNSNGETSLGSGFSDSNGSALQVNNIRPSSTDSQQNTQTPSSGGGSGGGGGGSSSGASPNGTEYGGSGNGDISTTAPTASGILDNPLNPYAQIAYHFRLYVAGQGSSGQGGGDVTIAETGKTGFNIKEVKMQAYVGPNPTTRNTVQTAVSITVVEAMGTSFLDGLVVAHQRVGTVNYQKAFYYLSLKFMGYDESGAIKPSITEGMPSNGLWTWKLVISNIETHLNEGGATYTLQCTILHDSALDQEWLKTTEPVKIRSKTVGDFFSKLKESLNKSVVRNYQDQLVTYDFKLESFAGMPDPSKFEMVQPNASKNDPYRGRDMEEGERDTWNGHIPRGHNITELCENIIGISKQGRNLSIWGKQEGDQRGDNALPDGKYRTGVFYRAYPEVTLGEFHPASGNYKKTITYHIKPFRSLATQLHPTESNKKNRQEAVTAAKPGTRKRYDYIFTGMNTDVINFDIKFNTAWQAALPRFGGWEYYNDMVQTHAMYDQKAADELKQYRQNVNTAQAAVKDLQNIQQIQNSGVLKVDGRDVAVGSDISRLLGTQTALAQTTLGQNNQAALDKMKQIEQANSKYGALGASGTNFVEDDLSYGQGIETYISFAQTSEGARRAAGSGASGPKGTRGRGVYGALLEQLYDPSMFQVIDLTIRGDPFWLGDAYETLYFGTQEPSQYSPNPAAGDCCFTLFFKYPNGVHEDTGSVTFRDQDIYSGLYRCATVESNFVDGMFTQVLHGTRIVAIDAETANSLGGGKQGAAGAASGAGTINPTNAFNLNGINGASNVAGGLLGGTTNPGFAGLAGSLPNFVQNGLSGGTTTASGGTISISPSIGLGGFGGTAGFTPASSTPQVAAPISIGGAKSGA